MNRIKAENFSKGKINLRSSKLCESSIDNEPI